MVVGFHKIVYLFAVLIVAVRTREETRVAPVYNYVEASCINLMPSQMMQSNMSPQAGEDAPFRAMFMNNNEAMYTYRPDHEYRITISSDKDDLFMGFIANMRLARDPSVIVGTVIEPQDNNTLIKTMTCNGANNTATQMRITQHTSVEFIWIAPADLNETVILRFGVFKNRSLFWNDLHTPCIVPVGVNLFPSICDAPMSSSTFSSSSSSSSSIVLPSVSVDVSSLHVHTSSLSSSTTFQSMPRSNSARSSSISITQPTVASLFTSSTQLYSNPLPTPSTSEVLHSTVIKSEQPTQLIPTRSILLLSKVLTYTYTSTSMLSPTSVVVNTATILNDVTIAFSPMDVTSTSTKLTSSTAEVTRNKMTSSSIPADTTSVARTANGNENTLSAIPTAVTSNKKDGLLENTSEMMAIGIAIGFVLIIIVSQIIIVTVGCIYKRRQNKKSRSRSLSFRTLYSLDTASVRSESIRRSYRLYNRDQVDLKLNIIEVDECPNSNNDISLVPHTQDDHTCHPSSNNDSSSLPDNHTQDSLTCQLSSNADSPQDHSVDSDHTCQPTQPLNDDSVARSTNIQVDVHSTDQ